MRKSGILTFHKSINYGSVLQAWALQQFFKKRGFEAEIIDYEPSAYSKLYSTLKKPNSISNIKYDLKNLPILGILERQSRLFKTFRHHNMCLSEKSYTVDSDLSCMIEKYNNVICGSDQIWNVRAYDCDATFSARSISGEKDCICGECK